MSGNSTEEMKLLEKLGRRIKEEKENILKCNPKLQLLLNFTQNLELEAEFQFVDKNLEENVIRYRENEKFSSLKIVERKKLIEPKWFISEWLKRFDLNFKIGEPPFISSSEIMSYLPQLTRITFSISENKLKENYDEEGDEKINKFHQNLLKLFNYDYPTFRKNIFDDSLIKGIFRKMDNEIILPNKEELIKSREEILKSVKQYTKTYLKPKILCGTFGKIFRTALNESDLRAYSLACNSAYSKVGNWLICHDITLVVREEGLSLYDSISSSKVYNGPIPLKRLFLYPKHLGLGIIIEREE